jgi:cell division protein FtsA
MRSDKIAAIDVGATKVCTIMADTNDTENVRILGVGVAPSQGLKKGTVVNTKMAAASISQSVRKAEKMAGYSLKSAYVSISGNNMISQNNHGVISIPRNGESVQYADRKRALEIGRDIEIPNDQRLLHVIPRNYTLDGQRNIKDPVGMHGFRLDVETHVITTPTIPIQNLTKCIISLGISIDGMVLKSLASAEGVLTEDERQNGVMVADIGSATTDVVIFKEGSVYSTLSVPIGGNHVTNDIAIGMSIPFEVAETMKIKYGSVQLSEEEDNIDATVTEDGKTIPSYDLCMIISCRVEELLRVILFQIEEKDYEKVIPSGLVLTGGSSNLTGITKLGHEVAGLLVRRGIPFHPDTDDSILSDPAFATSVGLLYWGVNNGSSQAWRTKRWGLEVLLPRWLGYFSGRKLARVK